MMLDFFWTYFLLSVITLELLLRGVNNYHQVIHDLKEKFFIIILSLFPSSHLGMIIAVKYQIKLTK